MTASRTRETTYLGARYHRLMPRLGKNKTPAALEHSILTAVWHTLTDDLAYQDLGGDNYARHDPERAIRRIPARPTPSASPSASTPSRPDQHTTHQSAR
ncbi:hypothetical protein LUZ28_29135 [Streptomyces albireticuli]|nr:hypothetical protein [Streptomyces albireticuli]MCD9146110.1 hypothetical protein [Streptomyces albireticuli]MCD9166186.1 hypothetical protein [Streptomyces albireticuli]MCD9196498.1 hypothetical protein [Streptomyces albireticuli]